MDRVKVNTAQNVYIDYEAAGVGDRAVAAIFDMMLLISYVIFMMLVLADNLSTAVVSVITLPYLLYFLLAEIFFNGQTVGKKTSRHTGYPAGWHRTTPGRLCNQVVVQTGRNRYLHGVDCPGHVDRQGQRTAPRRYGRRHNRGEDLPSDRVRPDLLHGARGKTMKLYFNRLPYCLKKISPWPKRFLTPWSVTAPLHHIPWRWEKR